MRAANSGHTVNVPWGQPVVQIVDQRCHMLEATPQQRGRRHYDVGPDQQIFHDLFEAVDGRARCCPGVQISTYRPQPLQSST
jgi:hypothetical protein